MKKRLLNLVLLVMSLNLTLSAQDVGITRISTPQGGCDLTAETVRVDVFNYGSNLTFTTLNVSYRLDTNSAVTQTQVLTSFNSNATQTVTFTVPINFTGNYGKHTLTAYTSLANDVDPSNDTLQITLFNDAPSNGGTLIQNDTVCQVANGDTLRLAGFVGDIQQWEKNTGTGWSPIVHTESTYIFTNLKESTSYRVLVKNGSCSPAYSNEIKITVEAPADAGILEKDKAVCAGGDGDTLRLRGYHGVIQKWQLDTGNGWSDLAHTADTLIYPPPTSNRQYRVMVDKQFCPTDTSNTARITIITSSSGGKIQPHIDTVCRNLNRDTLVLRNSVGNVKEWQISDDDGFTWQPIINSDTIHIYNNLSGNRMFRAVIHSNGCIQAVSDTATIITLAPPIAGSVFRDKSVCGGTNKDTMILKSFTGKIGLWQFDNGSGWTDINHQKDTLFIASILKTTSYRAIVGNRVCADDTSTTATLSVISTTYGGEIYQSDSLCKGANRGELVLRNHIGDIRWWEKSTDRGVQWTPIANHDTVQGFVNLDQTTWYRVLVEGRNCPNDYSDTAVLTTYTPYIKITANDSTKFCAGDSVKLSATSGFQHYHWNTGDSVAAINVYTDGVFRVTGTDRRGCKNADSIRVTVYALPIADAGEDVRISLGSSVQLMGSGGVVYNWSPGTNLTDSTIANPFASPLETTLYTLLVVDGNGCTDSDSVWITVNRDFNISGTNVITPNGDGINDTWTVKNILPYETANVTIINRYGHVVFETSGYDNSWDGRSGGNVVPDGTYYFIITFSDNHKVVKGHITVISK